MIENIYEELNGQSFKKQSCYIVVNLYLTYSEISFNL